MKRSPIFKFFASLKLAVISILLLATVLAVATITESYFGMRAAHVMIYGTWWFAGVLFLLGLNVLCAALSRYPWKRHQTGFVVTHLGIITILVGSLITQKFGVDGNLPIVENTDGGQVLLNDLTLVFTDEAGNIKRQMPVPESGKAREGRLLELSFSENERFVVDKFWPRIVPETRVAEGRSGSGLPAMRVELFNERFQVEQWLFHQHPDRATEMSLGPAILSFQKLWAPADEAKFLQSAPKALGTKKSLGYILAQVKGREYRIEVESAMNRWREIAGTDLKVRVERYLPYAIVQGKDLISKSKEPVNPAVQLTLENAAGTVEKHSLFSKFPEFNTLHERTRDQSKSKIEVKFRFVSNAGGEEGGGESLAMVGNRRGRLNFALSADGKSILYRVFNSRGEVTGSGRAKAGEAIPTGWMDLRFKVTDFYANAVQESAPRYVEYIAGGDANFLSGLRYRRESGARNPTANDPGGRWLVEGSSDSFSVGNERLVVQFAKDRLVLPFTIFLNKFTIGNDPGTNKAATYESRVTLKDPTRQQEFSSLISMNEPLKYGGYTFYQASYQLEEGRPPVSIFSVNYDPGRMVKYAGALLMVIGSMLMFYMNPHYWNKLLGGKK